MAIDLDYDWCRSLAKVGFFATVPKIMISMGYHHFSMLGIVQLCGEF
jgi:hypothetical protein